MKRIAGIVFAVVISFLALPRPSAGQDVAFVNVNVVPMDRERVLLNQTVVVRSDRITAVGAADQTAVPAGALRIDGRGKYLMPGLTEMHAHIPDEKVSRQFMESVLVLFLANGVTTIRGVLGVPGQLALRDRANHGQIVAPNMYLAGPGFSGTSANGVRMTSPEQAIRQVREQKTQGWNLLKVLPGLGLPEYDAMARTAKEAGIRFVGHVPPEVGLLHALEMGQETIEHMDGYIEYLHGDTGPVDNAQLLEVVRKTREAGTWVVPTMVHRETVIGTLDINAAMNYPELQYMPPDLVQQWRGWYREQFENPQFNRAAARQVIANRMRILKALHDGGAGILLGTDSTQRFNVPGFSIHRELKRMVEAGMTPFEVLKSGTQDAGVYFRNEDTFGTIAVGRRADMILVDANPLQDVSNVARRSGVMVRGTWMPEADLQARLDQIARSYR
jgi:hypothetical protein